MIFNVSNMKVSEIVLVSIAVTSQPSTTGYNYGSTFDQTGTVITATYSNGRTRNVTNDCVFTNTSMTTVGTQTVGVTYTEKGVTVNTSLNVTVYNILSSIAITTQPSTRTYNHHANFNPSGAVVTATWADGTTSNVTSEVTWSPTTLDTVGTQTITASYTYRNVTQTTTTTVTVNKVASSLSVSGSWSNTQYTGQAPTTAGLTFTCTYSDGSTASVTPSVSPSTWANRAGAQTATFSYTENGVTVSATMSASVVKPGPPTGAKRVGGTIFYINTSSSNTYTFYDSSGTVVSAPSVGSNYTNYYYTKSGSSVDKFYVYYPSLITSKKWGYYGITTGATGNSIGAGKTNTSTILAITDTSEYASYSIWKYIKDMRTNKTNGCNDWFVGCDVEYDQLRSSGTTGASWFSSNLIWSSREDSSFLSYGWEYYKDPSRSNWYKVNRGISRVLAPLRAF